ncbi:HD-GYP domain-containing protein [Desulforamulus reducens]|nr:HD domain-containing phosphohydrolase [Desulforamulus reducens]
MVLNRAIELIKPCPGLFDHAQDVARLVFNVAGTLGLDTSTLKTAALVHDVGKCTWPKELHIRYPLQPEDLKIIRTHPVIGEKILCDLWPDIPKKIRELVRWHHERPGGLGYPDQLHNPSIEVLVLASCDVFSAITSDRPYRVGTFPISEALMEVAKFAPPQIVAALADAVLKRCVNY